MTGNKLYIFIISIAPIIADIGSTIADNTPIKNDVFLDTPLFNNGILTAEPSGMFCIPIPIDSDIALITGLFMEAKATPIAIPSGILCNIIDVTNSILLLLFFLLVNISPIINNIIVIIIIIYTIKTLLLNSFIDSINKENIDDDNIIPADILNNIFITFLLILLNKDKIEEPNIVIKHAIEDAIIVCVIGFKEINLSNIFIPHYSLCNNIYFNININLY